MTTITDVARHAGVSVSTVSYALSGVRPIKPETRSRIEASMKELGYQPNANARSLASRKTNVIAMIYPDVDRGPGSTGGEFIHAAAERARELGYHLVLWPFRHGDDTGSVRDLVHQQMADGVLMMGVHLDDPRVTLLEGTTIPYAMIGRTRDENNPHSVDIDFDATLKETLQRLVGLGHREIAFINHSEESRVTGYGPTIRAAEAYDRYMREHGLRPISRHCPDSPVAGRELTVELLNQHPGLTALITMNELATFGVLGELHRREVTVPDDVSVIGVATSPGVSAMSNPPLTTMDVPGVELGRLAVDCLVGQLESSERELPHRLIPCIFGAGMSIGPARTK